MIEQRIPVYLCFSCAYGAQEITGRYIPLIAAPADTRCAECGRQQREIPPLPPRRWICDTCHIDILVPKGVKLLRTAPLGTPCDYCGEIVPSENQGIHRRERTDIVLLYNLPSDQQDIRALQFRAARHDQATRVAEWIRSHGIHAHATLTGLVRAQDAYTYRDDDGMQHYDCDWTLMDPYEADVIYEFLGY